ncbi:MAG: hypothetical protein ACP5JJ_16285 [Anaerolineae bacterium]
MEQTWDTDFPVRPVWFNASLYSRERALWRALISRVLQGVCGFDLGERALSKLRQLEARLYRATETTCGSLTLPPGMIPGQASVALPAPAGLELLRRQMAPHHFRRAGDVYDLRFVHEDLHEVVRVITD